MFVVLMKMRKPKSRKWGISVETLAELAQHLFNRKRSRSQGLPQDQVSGSNSCVGLCLTLLWWLPMERGRKAAEKRKNGEQESCGRKRKSQLARQAGLLAKWEPESARGGRGGKDVGKEEEQEQEHILRERHENWHGRRTNYPDTQEKEE